MEFKEIFAVKKPIIGMIHLAGSSRAERTRRALEELMVYEEEGVDGAIFEDHAPGSTPQDVYAALEASSSLSGLRIVKGVNLLKAPYFSFQYASDSQASFVQFDNVQTRDLDLELYDFVRRKHHNIAVLGGIGFKYTNPTGNPLQQDLREGMSRCEAIVTTGPGTGVETPLEKIREYKAIMGDFPLLVGAGVNKENIYSQLEIADGAIIGSYFKEDKNIQAPVERQRVRNIIALARLLRR